VVRKCSGVQNCKKGQVTPRGPKWVFPKIEPPQISLDLVSLAHGPKMGGAKSTPPCVPLRVQLPIFWFWAPEGEWGYGIGKGGCPVACILGEGYGKAHRMYFLEGLSQKKRVALRAPPA